VALTRKLNVLRSLLASHSIPGVVVVFPVLGGRFERYPHRELDRAVVAAAEGAGLAAVDLLDCYTAYGFRDLVDVVHPSPLGHRVAARATRDALLDDVGAGETLAEFLVIALRNARLYQDARRK
jgi:hypothetical protein